MRIPQDKKNLEENLREQYRFLIKSMEEYDNGNESEAKRMALAIRIMLYDTEKQKSLLTLLNKKDIDFYDTSSNYDPDNLVPHTGLLVLNCNTGKFSYRPICHAPQDLSYSKIKTPFSEWWDKIVFSDNKKNIFSRKYIIDKVANQDGGAHVDAKIDEPYHALSRENSLGWSVIQNDNGTVSLQNPLVDTAAQSGQKLDTKPVLASIRQIAYEVAKTLEDFFPEIKNNKK